MKKDKKKKIAIKKKIAKKKRVSKKSKPLFALTKEKFGYFMKKIAAI